MLVAVAALALAGLGGCGKKGRDPQQVLAQAPSASRDIFTQRCATCHGPGGQGDGPAGAALNPHPRNFTDTIWQRSVSDDHLRQIIVGGGMSVGKSPLMPPNADLANQPQVVNGLVGIVRGLGS
jgi:mono/diheme cytochrome c family protein